MKKRVIAICLLAAMVLGVFCGCSGTKGRRQITVIAENLNTWLMNVEEGTKIYAYAVTDMDQNGRFEIIALQNYGKGPATEATYYEVNEDGTELQQCEHIYTGDSQADIMFEDADVYEDPDTKKLYYVFTDTSGNGFRKVYNTTVAVGLSDGKVTEERLATESVIYEGESEVPTVTYTDADGNVITEDQYKNCAEQRFEGFEKKSASFGWKAFGYKNHVRIAAEGEPNLSNMLIDSFLKFGIEK